MRKVRGISWPIGWRKSSWTGEESCWTGLRQMAPSSSSSLMRGFFQLTGPFVDGMVIVLFPQAKRSTTQWQPSIQLVLWPSVWFWVRVMCEIASSPSTQNLMPQSIARSCRIKSFIGWRKRLPERRASSNRIITQPIWQRRLNFLKVSEVRF